MFYAESLKSDVYVASRSFDSENSVAVYSEPKHYRVSCYNVLPTSANADVTSVGVGYSDAMRIVGDPEYLSGIHELDKVYLNIALPEKVDKLATGANYVVKGIATYPTATNIFLTRLTVGLNERN